MRIHPKLGSNKRKHDKKIIQSPIITHPFFNGFTKKLVTVRKILKSSLKWDQSGIFSFIRSEVTSKTRLIVQKKEKFNDLYLMKEKNVF